MLPVPIYTHLVEMFNMATFRCNITEAIAVIKLTSTVHSMHVSLFMAHPLTALLHNVFTNIQCDAGV